METMQIYKSQSEERTLRIIYNYLKLNMLTNPECSFLSENKSFLNSETFEKRENQIGKSFFDFKNEIDKIDWKICLCVAGTDKSDFRRVVLNYSRDESVVIVNFPMAREGMTENEMKIKEWIEKEISI